MKKVFDALVIGAGITGSFISRELAKYQLDVAVLEKNNDVGNGTTNANSAIIHSGYDPVPNTNKAKFNVLGNKMYDKIAQELDVSFSRIGSLTIATEESQVPLLHELEIRSKLNGVKVKILSKEEVIKLEKNISNCYGALYAPTAGIIDPFNLCIHAMENAVDNGVNLFLENQVINIEYIDELFKVTTDKDVYYSKVVINASGVYADKISSLLCDIDWSITPRKGEYFVLDHKVKDLVKHVIFPLPSEKGKGVLVSLTTSNNYIVGPSSEPVNDKDDVSTDALTLNEVKRQADNMVNNIPYNTLIRTFSGLRPTCSRHDFVIEKDAKYDHFIHVGGIESPGLVSSPAIAEYVVNELVGSLIELRRKPDFNPLVRRYPHLKDDGENHKLHMISKNPEFGEIICNCEQVSLGEIKDCLNRSVPPKSVKGVKRRVRAGYGKCQGGFCQAKIVMILAKHYKCSPLDIPYDDVNSNILLNRIKDVK